MGSENGEDFREPLPAATGCLLGAAPYRLIAVIANRSVLFFLLRDIGEKLFETLRLRRAENVVGPSISRRSRRRP